MRNPDIPFEVPWEAVSVDGKLHLRDKARYDEWLKTAFGDGERAMIIVLPLVADSPAYHAAAFRYYRATVLPLVSEAMGEANPEDAHEQLATMFLPPNVFGRRRKGAVGLKIKRLSTSMTTLTCEVFCDYLDRVIAWASNPDGLNIEIPMADRRWKITKQQKAFEHDAGLLNEQGF